MNLGTEQQILCIERTRLSREWVGVESAIRMASSDFYRKAEEMPIEWKGRAAVENDPRFKQPIPYLLLYAPKEGRFGCYLRGGGERRLHDLWSVGIGGHIDLADAGRSFRETMENGLARELSEEISELPFDPRPEFLGLINEERTAVGKVHIGLVYRVEVPEPDRLRPGREVGKLFWEVPGRLLRMNLELWSRLALKLAENGKDIER